LTGKAPYKSTNLRSLGVRLLAGSYLSVSNRNTAGLGSGSEDSKHVEGEQLVGTGYLCVQSSPLRVKSFARPR